MIGLVLALLYTSTARVNDAAVRGGALWVATGGGLERYDLTAGTRTRLYTTADGLDSNDVLRVGGDSPLEARTSRSACSLGAQGRFACAPAPPAVRPPPTLSPIAYGARETVRLRAGGHEIVGTDGAGVWVDGRRLTPRGQLCGDHVEALAEFRGSLWVGTFDAGACALEKGTFRAARAPFLMVNDLVATPAGLFVAAAEGLFRTRDGRRFRREARVRERGVNRLASAGGWLFATTPVALYAIRLDGRSVVRRWSRPAGSTALQAVAVSGANVWLASEDSGVILFRRGRFQPFDRASGLPSSWTVDVAPAPAGGAWVATLRDGAFEIGPEGAVRRRLAPAAWGLRLLAGRDRILFGTQDGIAGESLPLPDRRVHAILQNDEGLWVGTEGGLALFERR